MGVFALIYPGMLAGLLLAGMHAYLGIKIVERRLVFAGLTLAQLAAAGSIAAIVCGFEPHTAVSYAISVALTTLGAAAVALTPRREGRVSHEAIVAMLYVAAAAATAILTSAAPPHPAANILSVSLHTVAKTAVLYAIVALFLFAMRTQLASRQRLWDFIFYCTVGLAVTASVAIAGVLLVFAYLVAPPVIAIIVSERPRVQLAVGWFLGAAVTAAAILLAFKADLPAGATIAATFGLALLWSAVARRRP